MSGKPGAIALAVLAIDRCLMFGLV